MLSDRDFEIFREHMAKHAIPGSSTCPICGQQKWEVYGPVASLNYEAGSPAVLGEGGMPLLIAMCSTCFHVRHFAWLPIRDGAHRG